MELTIQSPDSPFKMSSISKSPGKKSKGSSSPKRRMSIRKKKKATIIEVSDTSSLSVDPYFTVIEGK
jgi:hypothetical protein